MKSLTEYLTFTIKDRVGFINITPEVEALVARSGIQEGLVLANAMHITASVFINDDEPGLHADYRKWLEHLAPFDSSPSRYAHNRTGEDNADAHMKRQIMGGRWWSPSPKENWISALGNKSSTANSTGAGQNGY